MYTLSPHGPLWVACCAEGSASAHAPFVCFERPPSGVVPWDGMPLCFLTPVPSHRPFGGAPPGGRQRPPSQAGDNRPPPYADPCALRSPPWRVASGAYPSHVPSCLGFRAYGLRLSVWGLGLGFSPVARPPCFFEMLPSHSGHRPPPIHSPPPSTLERLRARLARPGGPHHTHERLPANLGATHSGDLFPVR